jgi:hypothetical protein
LPSPYFGACRLAVSFWRWIDRELWYQAFVSACFCERRKLLRPMARIVSGPLNDETTSQAREAIHRLTGELDRETELVSFIGRVVCQWARTAEFQSN